MGYDVFISYAHADKDRVHPLADALTARGLRVWIDRDRIDDTRSITDAVAAGLAGARMLVAWYSPNYARSRACQWEMTAAYLAAEAEGETGDRIALVGAGRGVEHIHPVALRDARFMEADAAPDALARRIEARRDLAPQHPFGRVRTLTPADWLLGGRRTGSNRFVGRLPALWRVHSGLMRSSVAVISGAPAGTDLVQVQGMGGIGKSLLAEEYAVRFGPAHPGGVVWLSAAHPAGAGPEAEESAHGAQIAGLASALGIDTAVRTPDMVLAAVKRAMAERPPYLWVVDDLRADADMGSLRRWLAPTGNGLTLVTTRCTRLESAGTLERLELLAPAESYQLLTSRRRPADEAERADAAAIAAALGHHALAVDVARANIPLTGYATFIRELRNPDEDALELAAELSTELPTGHEPSIAATLLGSLRRLNEDGIRFLHLASLLAPEPIPIRLIESILGEAAQSESTGRRQARVGIRAAEAEALAELADDQVTVHILVSRTLRYRDAAPKPLRDAALAVMNRLMPAAKDIREHAWLRPLVPHAQALCEPLDGVEVAKLLGWCARFDNERGALRAALAGREREYAALQDLLGEEDPDTLGSMNNFASTLQALGDAEGAWRMHQTVLDTCRRVFGEEHPSTLTSMNNLAETLRALGDAEEARRMQQIVLDTRRRVQGEEHPDTLTAMNNLASTLRALGDAEEARRMHQTVLDTRRRVLSEEHPDTLISMNNFALTLWQIGERAEARRLVKTAHAIALRTLGPDHPRTRNLANGLAATGAAPPPSTPAP